MEGQEGRGVNVKECEQLLHEVVDERVLGVLPGQPCSDEEGHHDDIRRRVQREGGHERCLPGPLVRLPPLVPESRIVRLRVSAGDCAERGELRQLYLTVLKVWRGQRGNLVAVRGLHGYPATTQMDH